MCLFIKTIIEHTDEGKPETYEFTKNIEGAWHTSPIEHANRICYLLSFEREITVKNPNGLGQSALCTDFRIEERPQGGFAISCEHPFAND